MPFSAIWTVNMLRSDTDMAGKLPARSPTGRAIQEHFSNWIRRRAPAAAQYSSAFDRLGIDILERTA
jgi:hypothetical protein